MIINYKLFFGRVFQIDYSKFKNEKLTVYVLKIIIC